LEPGKENLLTLISEAESGNLVLPEFQRSFIWDRGAINELLVSILNNYFIGTLLLLEIDDENPPFSPRIIEGVSDNNIENPDLMILDGQQRITSLYYALKAPSIPLKWTTYPYIFFLNLEKALKNKWDEAVFSLRSDDNWVNEIQKEEKQFEERILPFTKLYDWSTFDKWSDNFRFYLDRKEEFNQSWWDKFKSVTRIFLTYQVALVKLNKNTNLETIVEVFERINRTGEPLSVFELLTARLYKKNIKLRDLWENTYQNMDNISIFSDIKDERYPRIILRTMALQRGQECKRRDIILLSADNFREDWNDSSYYVEQALNRICNFSADGYGVFNEKWLPYSTMISPLAAILGHIDSLSVAERGSVYEKLHKWYWSSIFTERYAGPIDTLSHRDYNQFIQWINNGDIPESIVTDESKFDITLKNITSRSAMYKGVICLISLNEAQDFFQGDSIELHELDDHHIFPFKYLEDQGYQPQEANTLLNKTLISSDTNRSIRKKSPGKYLKDMEKRLGKSRTEIILKNHFILKDAYEAMKRNDYKSFLISREEAIISEIKTRCYYLNS